MSDFEVAQLLDTGYSIQRYGTNEYVCRNYIKSHNERFEVIIPSCWKDCEVLNLTNEKIIPAQKVVRKEGIRISFTASEGDYVIRKV